MRTRLRNITITLEENVARWARLEAARRDMSVSRLLAGILKERMREQDAYEAAMRRALARKPFLKTDRRYLSREEAHDRSCLR
jgi:predicted DNA-binding ribbon-helix-helix protein